ERFHGSWSAAQVQVFRHGQCALFRNGADEACNRGADGFVKPGVGAADADGNALMPYTTPYACIIVAQQVRSEIAQFMSIAAGAPADFRFFPCIAGVVSVPRLAVSDGVFIKNGLLE